MDNDVGETYSKKEIENIIANSFNAGVCYGAALTICQDKYPNETVMNVARDLMDSAMPGFKRKYKGR